MQTLCAITLALLAAPAALAADQDGVGFRFGGEAGRARIIADADELDEVPEVTWPDRQIAAALQKSHSPARASLIKQQSATSTAHMQEGAWAHMQGLVDGFRKDAEEGTRDASVEQVMTAEQAAKRDTDLKREAEREENALQKQGTAASDLDLVSAVKAARDYGGKTASPRSPTWLTLRGEVDGVASRSESVWEAKVEGEVESMKGLKSEVAADESATQKQQERYGEAQRAKARYDAIRRKQRAGVPDAPVRSPLEDDTVLLQANGAKPKKAVLLKAPVKAVAGAPEKSKTNAHLTRKELERTEVAIAKAAEEELEAAKLIRESHATLDGLMLH